MLPFVPVWLLKVEEIISMIQKIDGIRGVTILGGEPLNQSGALLTLARRVKELGLEIMLYTGFNLDELTDDDAMALVKISDIVVSGPYDETKRDISLRWRGSTNQKITFNDQFNEDLYHPKDLNEVEIHISESGELIMLGYPDNDLRRAFLGC